MWRAIFYLVGFVIIAVVCGFVGVVAGAIIGCCYVPVVIISHVMDSTGNGNPIKSDEI